MHGGAQAFCQPGKADGRLNPFTVTDAFRVIQNVAAIQYGRRLTKGERLHFLVRLDGGQISFCLAAIAFAHRLKSRMDLDGWPLAAVSGSFNRACMVAHATSA